MSVLNSKKKNIIKATILMVFISIVCIFSRSFGMQHYYNVGFTTGLVTAGCNH